MSTVSDESLLDGVPRSPLIPQLPVAGWEIFSNQNLEMYRWLYDAICKIRNGEITLVDPTTSDNYDFDNTEANNNKVVNLKFANSAKGYIKKSIFTGFGQLLVSHDSADPRVLANPGAGHNDEVLTLDDTQENGVKWAPAGGGASSVVSVTKSGTQTLADGVTTTITLDTELVDSGGDFAANTFTCATAGNYNISFMSNVSSSYTATLNVYIKHVSGVTTTWYQVSPYFYVHGVTVNDFISGTLLSLVLPLAAGDTINAVMKYAEGFGHTATVGGLGQTVLSIYGPI